jgi:very-short-patch-repair endonuclease
MTNKRIYLAGKISKGDWRGSIVSSTQWPNAVTYSIGNDHLITSGRGISADGACGNDGHIGMWPILENSVLGIFDYVGPYFVGCDHGCFHGSNTHGSIDGGNPSDHQSSFYHYDPDAESSDIISFQQFWVRKLCLDAIKKADVVFAWIDSPDAFGTFTELGYAAALRKEILIAGPKQFPDMWFIYATAGTLKIAESPLAALQAFIAENKYIPRPQFDSPLEEKFWDAWQQAGGATRTVELEYQYNIPDTRYRVDFANIEEKVAIELDGYEYHNSKDQFTNDRKRQRELENIGWRVIRFSGSEVYKNPNKCFEDAASFIVDLWYKRSFENGVARRNEQ